MRAEQTRGWASACALGRRANAGGAKASPRRPPARFADAMLYVLLNEKGDRR